METRLISILGVALAVAACGSATSNTDGELSEAAGLASSAAVEAADDRQEAPEPIASGGSTSGASPEVPSEMFSQPSAAPPAGPNLPEYQEVMIPNGTQLLLSLTTPIGSDTSVVEDAVRAELRQSVEVEGREILPAGTQVEGSVISVDGAGRVTGRATVAFRLTSIQTDWERYELQVAPVSQMAPATRGEDAIKIGIGAGAGALIGGLLGGADGAAKGAAVGGGAGAGAVLATRGEEVRLESGAEVMTELTSPLTVRIPRD